MSEPEVNLQSPSIEITPATEVETQAEKQVEAEAETQAKPEVIPEITAIQDNIPIIVTEQEEVPQIMIVTDEEGQEKSTEFVVTDNTADESETTLPDDESSYSTVTPESLNDDTKPIHVDQTDFQGPVIDFYKNKNILMTGATGFVGKAILWKLIQALRQDIGSIYILVRSGSIKRSKIGKPEERLRNEIFNNKAFLILRRMMGKNLFDSIVKNKIIPIAGDIISPDLSMTDFDREKITENVNVVIHCAATLNYNERLDLALETNTLGTLRMMDLADECKHMEAFVYMSLAYTDPNIPDGHVQERVYPMKVGDPEELLTEIVDLELQDIPKMTQRILAHYPNTYTFTKSLTEHLIMKRVDLNRIEEAQLGKAQWPVAIVRATQVGAGVFEPLPGWVDGVTGANGAVFLMGKGIQALQPDMGELLADIVPVDYLVRAILGSAAFMKFPGFRFLLPYNEVLADGDDSDSIIVPNIQYFPYIYQVSASGFNRTTWNKAYNSVRTYWHRNTKLILPSAEEYFVANRSLFKAKFFMKYHLPQSISSVTGAIGVSKSSTSSSDANATNRTIEVASRVAESVQPFLRHRWIFDHQNVQQMEKDMSNDLQFSLSQYENINWETYMINFAFGVHAYITQSPPAGLRNITVPAGWACALYLQPGSTAHTIIDKQIESVIFSASDIQKRTDRMLQELISSLEKPGQELKDKKKMEEWVNDFDASLDDWCHDDSDILKDTKNMAHLGHWVNTSDSHEEHIRIEVLNDRRVGQSIRQIIETSGVPQKTVVGESLKILQRMKERTQLPYIWSAGAFLNTLFKRLFTSLRINELDIAKLKEQIQEKNVVYVPVSKTIIDQLLVWYICLRYKLPVPAIVCDEALALLGPISDILRISGAYFVRRDLASRSPLNSSVAAAYTEVLLKEHGALSMVVERARSRTGRLQTAYHDGLINMVIDGTLGKNQASPPHSPQPQQKLSPLPTPTGSFSSLSVKKETVFIPVNITYEKIPELRTLIDQVLDQKPRSLTVTSTFLRPSATLADRAATKENGIIEQGKYGRAFVGFGNPISVRDAVKEASLPVNTNKRLSTIAVKDEDTIADFVVRKIQRGQHDAAVVSPVTLVAATLLFGRVTSGITLGKINKHVTWLREEIVERGISIDWQPDEDVTTIVSYALNLLDARNNVTMDGKRVTEHTIVRVVEHADNVMDLSYMASQLIEIFLPEALFAVVYLSGTVKKMTKEELYAHFTFLVRLFKHEFIYPWSREEKFNVLLDWFIKKNLLVKNDEGLYTKVVTIENNEAEYTRVCLLASLIYPTLDAYWITSCSLSALRDLPYMPRKIVPVLSQWIAAHLITGRRTVYREVLSTEASQNAVDNFLAIGFIDAVHPKTKLSPDAQILLLELGITTNEDLVMVSTRNIEENDTISDVHESENILLKLEDIASLCHEIEKYRFVTDNVNLRSNAQVFDKCQNQIRSILRADQSYATQHGMNLDRDEDQMIQLVYSLKAASSTPILSDDGSGKHSRRVSQAYNLKSS